MTTTNISFTWDDEDPRVQFLMQHLRFESVDLLFKDMADDVIDVWFDGTCYGCGRRRWFHLLGIGYQKEGAR